MSSLPFHLDPITATQHVVVGDVVIAAGVAIAPGVLLQADPGSRIVLRSGVCLGMGCVIHASGGEISIGVSANLGAGVLVVGATTIGDRALVGAGTTVFGQAIEPGAMIAPSSLLVNEVVNTETTFQSTVETTPKYSEPEPEKPAEKVTVDNKVAVDNNGFFFSKNAAKVKTEPARPEPATTEIEDPWQTPPEVKAPMPVIEPIAPVFNTSNEPTSTFVYPEDNCLPKHPWADTGIADLGPQIEFKSNHSSFSSFAAPQPGMAHPQPHPESDLSAAEMQADGGQLSTNQSSALASKQSKQVYGQAYVNQMLGKMLGKN
jgi:carbon dioxide concentrating mechanism protein CcmN